MSKEKQLIEKLEKLTDKKVSLKEEQPYKATVDQWLALPNNIRKELSDLNFSAFMISKIENTKFVEVTVNSMDISVEDIKNSIYLERILYRVNTATLFFKNNS